MGVNGYFGAAELHEFRSLANGAMPGVRDLDAVVQLDGTQAIFNLNDKNLRDYRYFGDLVQVSDQITVDCFSNTQVRRSRRLRGRPKANQSSWIDKP